MKKLALVDQWVRERAGLCALDVKSVQVERDRFGHDVIVARVAAPLDILKLCEDFPEAIALQSFMGVYESEIDACDDIQLAAMLRNKWATMLNSMWIAGTESNSRHNFAMLEAALSKETK